MVAFGGRRPVPVASKEDARGQRTRSGRNRPAAMAAQGAPRALENPPGPSTLVDPAPLLLSKIAVRPGLLHLEQMGEKVSRPGYVDLLLTWTPLRNRLLAPFREELVADAASGTEKPGEYFDGVQAQQADSPPKPLCEAIPDVHGQIVLEGESGLGKSIFLRRFVKGVCSPVVYLPAQACHQGVLEAIQLRL